MNNEITKAELEAIIDVQSKTAQQMERIATALNSITVTQKEILEKHNSYAGCTDIVKLMAKEITFIKWTIASISMVVGLGMVITNIVEHLH